jgi:hypothetical protein
VVGLSSSLALRSSWSVWGVITLMELSGDGDPWRPDPGSNPSTWRLVTRGMWVGRWSPGASGFHGVGDVSIGLDQRHGGQLGQGRKVVGLSSSLALRGSWSVWGVITMMELSGDGDPW